MITSATFSDIESRANELRKIERELCEKATSEVKAQIAKVEEDLRFAKLQKNIQNKAVLEEMAKKVGEMAEMSFKIFVFGGHDNAFQIDNKLNHVEVRDPDEGVTGGWFNYFKYNSIPSRRNEPSPDELNDGYRRVLRQYRQFVLEAE